MPEGSLPSASHRPNRGFHRWVRNPVLPRCLLRVSPDPDERVRPARDFFHHAVRHVLLCHHAVRIEECGRDVPTSVPDRPLALCGGSGAALAKTGSGQIVDSVNIPARELGPRPCTRATA
ncbi:hypothetical protein ACJX0J_010377, partial [Zea mays]